MAKSNGGNIKGFVVFNMGDLINTFKVIFTRGTEGLIQEIIPGPDTNQFKASCYLSRDGVVLLSFGLQKIRQQPVGFGFGCLAISIEYPELLTLGESFFTNIGFRCAGSTEFKRDERDGKVKLIEFNPRSWQQNALADICAMNFPLIHSLELTGGEPKAVLAYQSGIKWVNIYRDIESFREYRKRGSLSFMRWVNSLKGEKIYSDLALDDLLPGLH